VLGLPDPTQSFHRPDDWVQLLSIPQAGEVQADGAALLAGADDFIGQVLPAMQTVEAGLMLVNAQNGVEVGTEIQSRFAEQYNLPIIFVINELDHEKANFNNSVDSLKQRFGNNVIVAQYPLNPGHNFDSIIDVITMKMYKYNGDKGGVEILDIPQEYAEKAAEIQNELIEKAAENDDELMEIFFENDGLTEDEMRKGITEGLIQRGIFPVFCTTVSPTIPR